MTSTGDAFRLLAHVTGDGLRTRDSQVELTAGSVLHAVDAEGRWHLLLPVAADAPDTFDNQSRGVTASTRVLIGQNEAKQRFVDLRCDDSRLLDLFCTVCDEILADCGDRPDDPRSVVLDSLARWRELLGPAAGRLLADNAVAGLLAELHVLEHLVAEDASRALKVWTGPDAARHDFVGASTACEVKASTSLDQVKIRINGLRQLQAPDGKGLYLVVERLEKVPVGGDALGEAVDRIVALGANRHALLTVIQKIGVAPRDLDAYDVIRFDVIDRRVYVVDDAFPRLVPATINLGGQLDRIGAVSYDVDVSAQPPYPLEADGWAGLPKLLLGPDGAGPGQGVI